MLFKCLTDCYDNQRCTGYKYGYTYNLTEADIAVMKKNGLFPKVFEPADYEAQQFMKAKPEDNLDTVNMDSSDMAESETADIPSKRGRRGA